MTDEKEPQSIEESGSGASAPVKQPRKAPRKTPPRQLPPWKVLLHNDDVSEMEHVVKAIRQLTPLNKDEAIARMVEAHTTGISLLLTTHQERAELYVEQFATLSLTVTAEPES